MAIHIRAEAGYSVPACYEAVDDLDIGFWVGVSSNRTSSRLAVGHPHKAVLNWLSAHS